MYSKVESSKMMNGYKMQLTIKALNKTQQKGQKHLRLMRTTLVKT